MNTTPKFTAMYVAAASLAVLLLLPPRLAAQAASGPEVWAANCGSCHRLRSVDTYTASQWNTIATHMGLVARLTGAETRAVREFLVSSARAREAAETARQLAPDLAGVPATGTSGGAQGAAALSAQSGNAGPVTGRDVYRANCAACHGPEGRGNGPAAAALNPRPTDFTNAAQRQATTDSAVADVIEHGRRGMPAFGRTLRHAQVDSLVAHLKSFRR
jgi:mono/diheme cytochrome c family protein